MNKGTLYICGTPIGNLEDITIRVLNILKKVDLIAAEDTRRTQKLLNYYNIESSLTSYHEHNEEIKSKELLDKLKQGRNIAVVSDAGMPGISDPGYRIVKLARDEKLEIIPIPGPTAMTSALVVSGLPTDRFVFEGFLPRKNSERKKYLKKLKKETRTMVFYEAPHRLVKTLEDVLSILGDRKIVVCRELTKKFEEKIAGAVSEVLNKFKQDKPKGEIAFVLQGGDESVKQANAWNDLSLLDHIKYEMKRGLTKKEAIKEVAKKRKLPKSEVYQIGTKIRVNK